MSMKRRYKARSPGKSLIAPAFITDGKIYPGYYGELAWIITMLEFWIRDRAPDWRNF